MSDESIVAAARRTRHERLRAKAEAGEHLTEPELRELERLEGAVPEGCFATQKELAAAVGIHPKTVRNWADAGMPRRPDGLYSVRDVVAWRDARKNATRRRAAPTAAEKAETRRKIAAAELAELELAARRGELISRQEVEAGRVERLRLFRSALAAMVRSVSPLLEHRDTLSIRNLLSIEIERILRAFAGQSEHDEEGAA